MVPQARTATGSGRRSMTWAVATLALLVGGSALAATSGRRMSNGDVSRDVAAAATIAAGVQAGDAGSFINVGQCYRFVFPIPGAPDYKVRRVLGGGWLETEVDAGPSNAEREAVYVNLAQVVTARARRCSN